MLQFIPLPCIFIDVVVGNWAIVLLETLVEVIFDQRQPQGKSMR